MKRDSKAARIADTPAPDVTRFLPATPHPRPRTNRAGAAIFPKIAVQVHDLVKRYGNVVAVKGVSVRRGTAISGRDER